MSTGVVYTTARVRLRVPERTDGRMSNGDEYPWRSAPRHTMLLRGVSRSSAGWKITVLTLAAPTRSHRLGLGWKPAGSQSMRCPLGMSSHACMFTTVRSVGIHWV